MQKARGYDLRRCHRWQVAELCEKFHPYGSSGKLSVYAFGVFEGGRIVAGYLWMPPPIGSARSVCPEAPFGVLALSRMVAVPRHERALNHVSKPLRAQMKSEIDRTRWPVLVTYSDSTKGHTGHVYKCSGWEKTTKRQTKFYEVNGVRVSSYVSGKNRDTTGMDVVKGEIQRWEHWACERGHAFEHMSANGWERVEVTGKKWRNGSQVHTIVNTKKQPELL